jgi:hypothetical protein
VSTTFLAVLKHGRKVHAGATHEIFRRLFQVQVRSFFVSVFRFVTGRDVKVDISRRPFGFSPGFASTQLRDGFG